VYKRSEIVSMHSKTQQRVHPVSSSSTIVQDGPRAFPIREAFTRIGIKTLKGYELVNSGELQTFCIGRRRYATAEAIRAFLERCIAKSRETDPERARKVAAATKASLRSRAQRATA
jgi:hypothetical protein